MKWLARLLLRLGGWKAVGPIPAVPKSVIIAAPHTSNWDVPIFVMASFALEVPVSFLVKHTAFWWPLSVVLRAVGGVPVNRGEAQGVVKQAVNTFAAQETLHLALAPEGTRRKVRYWKKGFYHIAREAGVPIVMAFVDFRRREVGLGPMLQPSGDIHADMAAIRRFYAGVTARHPARVGPVEVR